MHTSTFFYSFLFNENSHHVESLFRYEIETQDKRMGHESSPVPVLKSIFLLYLYRKRKLLRKICIKDFHSINILLVHCNQKIRGEEEQEGRKVFIFYFIYIPLLVLPTMLKVNKICFFYLMNNFLYAILNWKVPIEMEYWHKYGTEWCCFEIAHLFWIMSFCYWFVWNSFVIILINLI